MEPFDYNSTTIFENSADLSMAGMAQDCAECHVGGGPMEYVPAPNMVGRTSLRNIKSLDVNTYGPITYTDYTTWNYFIDTYDVDGDGVKTEALYMDWEKVGVMEMDCLLCHLKGYDYDARTEMLRQARFDASRAVGAGVAAPNVAALWANDANATDGYGTDVTYNSLVVPVSDSNDNATFSSDISMNIKASPPNDNCAFCHFNFLEVDWKKRGDNWKKDVDAHWVVGCMNCHEGKVGSDIGTSGSASDGALGQCDPAKGIAKYSGIWKTKDATIKTCEDCHLRAGYDSGLDTYSPDFGAPDPTGKHQMAGLLGKICQDGTDGVADASHLDIIHCTACHVRKISAEEWNTGGAIVDDTGADEYGRLADHGNHYVYRNMEDNLAYRWFNEPGATHQKIYPANVLSTVFWKDINGSFDANNDGQSGGTDAVLTTHILAVNESIFGSPLCMTDYYAGDIDATDVAARKAALEDNTTGINYYLGNTSGNAMDLRLNAQVIPFLVNHNVSPASYALGANGCVDCHDAGAQGIFNGNYDLKGVNMTQFSANVTTQLTVFSGTSDFYGAVTKSGAGLSLATFSTGGMGSVTRGDMLYLPNATVTKADGTGDCTNSTQWIEYLNGITGDEDAYKQSYPDANIRVADDANVTVLSYRHGYGVGCEANSTACQTQGLGADDNSTDGCNCTMIWDMYNVDLYDSLTFTATPNGDGYTYIWNFNDGTGQVKKSGDNVNDYTITHQFNSLGVKKVVLTVISPYGVADPQMINVNVVRP